MTVKELIEALSDCDDDMEVVINAGDINCIPVDGVVDNGDVIVIY
jgi:hypothetical protein